MSQHCTLNKCLFAFLIIALLIISFTAQADDSNTIPARNMVTMVDLGADKCVPCKLMAPILKKLKDEYTEKAAILFIDVWKDPDQAKKYGIRTIPTQIFFDQSGKEQYRHIGFMSETDIKKQLDLLLSM